MAYITYSQQIFIAEYVRDRYIMDVACFFNELLFDIRNGSDTCLELYQAYFTSWTIRSVVSTCIERMSHGAIDQYIMDCRFMSEKYGPVAP
ncbi:MAG: hypothetical protein HDQ88_04390 [Clostridia bacterium]|nr:hypothetical protein [Clostridia bacterium]